MIGLIILVFLAALILPFVLFVMVVDLRGRVNALEENIKVLAKKASSQSAAQPPIAAHVSVPTVAAPVVATARPVSEASVAAATVTEVATPDPIVEWLTDNWLLKLGAFLLLLGFGWLATYAFLHNWIGPAGRITLGLVGGALILSLGFWRARTHIAQGAIFMVLGATVVLLTTYAARIYYDFFTPSSALALMFATSAVVAYASGVYNRKTLAVSSLALAGFAPLLTHSPSPDYVSLFFYLLVVVLGALWLVTWKGYREVVVASLILVALYSAPIISGTVHADKSVMILFGYAFAALFYFAHTIALLRHRDATEGEFLTAVGNAFLLFGWIWFAAQTEWRSLILDAWAVVFAAGAFVVYRATGRRELLYLYSAIGAGYIVGSTALELHGAALTIAYIIESAAASLIIFGVTRRVQDAQYASFLIAGPTLLAIGSVVSSSWASSVFNKDFFVLAILSATYFVLGAVFWDAAKASGSKDAEMHNNALFVGGSYIAYILLWLTLHAAYPHDADTAVTIALFVYTMIGITTYVSGIRSGNMMLRNYGGILLGLVVARLLVVDVWHMALSTRIITFFLVGTLLMSTAFIGRKNTSSQ